MSAFKAFGEALTRVSLGFPFFLRRRPDHRGDRVTFSMESRDRETGEPTFVDWTECLSEADADALARDPRELVHWVRGCLQRLALHEVDEQVLWNGHRIFDPHLEPAERFHMPADTFVSRTPLTGSLEDSE